MVWSRLKNALLADKTEFDADRLKEVTEETIYRWVPSFPMPNISQRVDRIREVGTILASGKLLVFTVILSSPEG